MQVQEWSGLRWQHRLFESLIVFQNYVAGTEATQWLGPTVGDRGFAHVGAVELSVDAGGDTGAAIEVGTDLSAAVVCGNDHHGHTRAVADGVGRMLERCCCWW